LVNTNKDNNYNTLYQINRPNITPLDTLFDTPNNIDELLLYQSAGS